MEASRADVTGYDVAAGGASIRGRANHHELEEPVLVDIYKPAREPIRLLDSDLVCYNLD